MRVYQQAKNSVFTVVAQLPAGSRQGSAVAVSSGPELRPSAPTSWLATNYHVVGGDTTVTVRQGKRGYGAEVEYADSTVDIALLRVKGAAFKASPIALSDQVPVGEKVYAIGSPLGLESSISEGIVAAKRIDHGIVLIQTTAPISPGNSGGGLFDSQGNVIGITTFKITNGENLNFAITAGLLHHLFGALTATRSLRLYYEDARAPQSFLALLNSRFVTWLATTRNETGQLRYIEILAMFGAAIHHNVNAEAAADRITGIMNSYLAMSSGAVRAPSSRAAASGESNTVTLLCELDLGPSGKSEMTLTIDFGKGLVNGVPAKILADRIVFEDDPAKGVSLSVSRYSGIITGVTPEFPAGLPAGSCHKAPNRQF